MWCKFCGQDVPGIAGPEDGQFSCARCTKVIAEISTSEEIAGSSIYDSTTLECKGSIQSLFFPRSSTSTENDDLNELFEITMPHLEEDWQYDQDLNYVKRVSKKTTISDSNHDELNSFSKLNRSNAAIPDWHLHLRSSPKQFDSDDLKSSPSDPISSPSKLAWGILLFSVMGLVCGGVLMIWAMVTHRPVLWDLGLPITIASQASLLLGLILQIERMWRTNQNASNKMVAVDQQISDLKETTTMISTSGSGTGNAFYSHMTQGASNELLLADLKGQMDMLTRKISKQ